VEPAPAGRADRRFVMAADAPDQVLPPRPRRSDTWSAAPVRARTTGRAAVGRPGPRELGGQHVQVGGAEADLPEQKPDMCRDMGVSDPAGTRSCVQRGPRYLRCPMRNDSGAAVGDQPVQWRGPGPAAGSGKNLLWNCRSSSSSSAWKIRARVPNGGTPFPCPGPRVRPARPCQLSVPARGPSRARGQQSRRLRAASARSPAAVPRSQAGSWAHPTAGI